ncbi:hypothetical protein TeGR_g5546, partial [Tetraparma gracilis]
MYLRSPNVLEVDFPSPSAPATYLPSLLSAASSPSSPLVVKFYSPWCGHCRHFQPTWEEVGASLAGQDTGGGGHVTAAAVSCTKYGEVCSHFEVHGYPTLLAFNTDPADPAKTETIGRRGGTQAVLSNVAALYGLPSAKVVAALPSDGSAPPAGKGAEPAGASPAGGKSAKAMLFDDASAALLFTLLHSVWTGTSPPALHAWGGGPPPAAHADHGHPEGYEVIAEPWGLRAFLDMLAASLPPPGAAGPGAAGPGGEASARLERAARYIAGGVRGHV